ncbi:MAG TPA: sensor histidine kinase [Nocardioidaceae bacterium]|nr:sensor histidine kinase [Nocardioidaceae bacterium]
MPSESTPTARAPQLLRLGVHVLVGVLLVTIAVTAVSGGGPEWRVLAATAAVAGAYAAGLLPVVRRDRQSTAVWGAALSLAWVALVLVTPSGVWLAFPLFFLALHVLPVRASLPVVAVLTAVAVGGFAWHQGGWNVGGVLGPVLGALVAIGTVLGLRVVNDQSQRRGVLEERDRLAREIHDTLAQGLNSIHLLLGAADAHVEARPDEARRLIAQARTTAAENLDEARRFVRALVPTDLAERSLTEALLRVTSRSQAPPVSLEVSGEPVLLPGAVDVALLRIAQEAVGNAVRHAHASRIAVTLSYMDDEVALDVVDDGSGLAADTGGFGMTTMRERAERLGGELVIESTPSQGTAVAVSVPLGQR